MFIDIKTTTEEVIEECSKNIQENYSYYKLCEKLMLFLNQSSLSWVFITDKNK